MQFIIEMLLEVIFQIVFELLSRAISFLLQIAGRGIGYLAASAQKLIGGGRPDKLLTLSERKQRL